MKMLRMWAALAVLTLAGRVSAGQNSWIDSTQPSIVTGTQYVEGGPAWTNTGNGQAGGLPATVAITIQAGECITKLWWSASANGAQQRLYYAFTTSQTGLQVKGTNYNAIYSASTTTTTQGPQPSLVLITRFAAAKTLWVADFNDANLPNCSSQGAAYLYVEQWTGFTNGDNKTVTLNSFVPKDLLAMCLPEPVINPRLWTRKNG